MLTSCLRNCTSTEYYSSTYSSSPRCRTLFFIWWTSAIATLLTHVRWNSFLHRHFRIPGGRCLKSHECRIPHAISRHADYLFYAASTAESPRKPPSLAKVSLWCFVGFAIGMCLESKFEQAAASPPWERSYVLIINLPGRVGMHCVSNAFPIASGFSPEARTGGAI